MDLFSKRQNKTDKDLKNDFLPDAVRVRIQYEVTYIVSSNNYLEPLLRVHDENTGEYWLHEDTLKNLSLAELGYNITEIIDCKNLTFQSACTDSKLFDLVELMVIFCANKKREGMINRIKDIFNEENAKFTMFDSMVISQDNQGLQSIVPLLKEETLKKKLNEIYQNYSAKGNFEALARTSADIVQYIFSGNNKKETKDQAGKIIDKLSKSLTDRDNMASLSTLLDKYIRNVKSLNNEISNIRHTDKFTIPIADPNLYKLIFFNNMSVAEIVILSMPEEYIIKNDSTKMKNNYLEKYGLTKHTGRYIQNKEDEDLPF